MESNKMDVSELLKKPVIDIIKKFKLKKYIKICYPNDINTENWNCKVSDMKLPSFDGNLYFIIDAKYSLKYIGKSYDIKLRLKQHLVKDSDSTGSQLENVKNLICNNDEKHLYVWTWDITPKECNSYFETALSYKLTPEWCKRSS